MIRIEKANFSEVYPGAKIGRWTVHNEKKINSKGETEWFCSCECGEERYVLDRSLRYGGSLSCGCITRQKSRMRAYELAGRVFGDLTVIRRSEKKTAGRGNRWICQCRCGSLYETEATLLVTGRRKHCGCRDDLKRYVKSDVTNQRFHRLTALYPTKLRDLYGSVIWHCRCDCGNEVDVSYNELVYTNRQSCGCKKKEHDQELSGTIARADGTSIDHLKSQKIPRNNTTGIRGVYLVKGKYMAKIVFQKKQYFLGTYKTLAAAAEARREADEEICQKAVASYEIWKTKAEAEPEWAKDHPLQFSVVREHGRLRLDVLPALPDTNVQMTAATEKKYGEIIEQSH